MSDSSNIITSAKVEDERLQVAWADGFVSRYHFLWLRDNCLCVQCGNRAVGQKLVSLVDLAADETPALIEVVEHAVVRVKWESDGHLSSYQGSWLREHSYEGVAREKRRHQPILWDATVQCDMPNLSHDDCFRDDAGHYQLLGLIRDYGFALVHDVPCDRTAFLRMAERVGYVTETNYGQISDLVATQGAPRTLSNTKHGIPLHTDECYRHANPGLLAFQCLSASEDGQGVTLLADGFKIAEFVRAEHPEAFELLSKVPMASRRLHEDETDLHSQSPVISVDFEGRIQGIRYNERSAAPLDLPQDLITPAYHALRVWLSAIRDPHYAIRLLLRPGDFVVFDNQRILHGREHFGGNRHLLYCQLDLDEPHSRVRILERRLGLHEGPLVMHRGT